MSKIGSKDQHGNFSYSAFTRKELDEAKKLAQKVASEIPGLSTKISQTYSAGSSLYYFEIGRYLTHLISEENIPEYERRDFWKEVKELTSGVFKDKRADKGNRRSALEICYLLFGQGEELAGAIEWNRWVDIFGREGAYTDPRFFKWLAGHNKELSGDDFRQLLNLMTLFNESYNVEYLSDEEVSNHYDLLLYIIVVWESLYQEYFHSRPSNLTAARRNRLMFYRTKYSRECFKATNHLEKADYPVACRAIFIDLFVEANKSVPQ